MLKTKQNKINFCGIICWLKSYKAWIFCGHSLSWPNGRRHKYRDCSIWFVSALTGQKRLHISKCSMSSKVCIEPIQLITTEFTSDFFDIKTTKNISFISGQCSILPATKCTGMYTVTLLVFMVTWLLMQFKEYTVNVENYVPLNCRIAAGEIKVFLRIRVCNPRSPAWHIAMAMTSVTSGRWSNSRTCNLGQFRAISRQK